MLTKNRLQLEKHKEVFSWIFLTLFYLLDFWNHHEKNIKCKLIRAIVEFKCLEGCWMSVAWFSTMQSKSWYRLKRKNYTVFPKYAQYLHSWKNSKHIKNLLEVLLLIRKMVSGSRLRKSPTILASLEYTRRCRMQCKTENSLLGVKLQSTGLGLTSMDGIEHCGYGLGILQDWGKQTCEAWSPTSHSHFREDWG